MLFYFGAELLENRTQFRCPVILEKKIKTTELETVPSLEAEDTDLLKLRQIMMAPTYDFLKIYRRSVNFMILINFASFLCFFTIYHNDIFLQ